MKRKNATKNDEDSSGDESDVSIINVDFDFYNLNPDVDLIALKRLIRQTLSHDETCIDVHPLAELVLSEGARLGCGSTIKTDGEESDPWGLFAVVDVEHCRGNPALAPFLEYLASVVPSHSPVQILLNPISSPAMKNRPALVFSLRTLNLPLPLIPPLYRMTNDELASEQFTHWLVWGRGYRLEGSEEDMGLQMDNQKSNKRFTTQTLTAGSFPYHPEEEFLDKFATHVHTWPFKKAPERNAESFDVEQFGRLVVLESLAKSIEAMQNAS